MLSIHASLPIAALLVAGSLLQADAGSSSASASGGSASASTSQGGQSSAVGGQASTASAGPSGGASAGTSLYVNGQTQEGRYGNSASATVAGSSYAAAWSEDPAADPSPAPKATAPRSSSNCEAILYRLNDKNGKFVRYYRRCETRY